MNKKQKWNNQKGITLIALVITIIILLILAIVSIRLVMNSGIITRAEKGTEVYSEEEIKEKIKIAYGDYQASKIDDGNYTFEQALQDGGVNPKSVTGNDEEGYVVTVETKDGETKYNVSANGIEKVKTLEDYGLKIGDYVNYDCYTGVDSGKLTYTSLASKTGYAKDQTFTVSWRVLGIDNGNLLLISSSSLDFGLPFFPSDEINLTRDENIIKELNAISSIYGYGKNAVGGRSLNINDVNNISGYKPTGQDYDYVLSNYIKDPSLIELIYTNTTLLASRSSSWLFGIYHGYGNPCIRCNNSVYSGSHVRPVVILESNIQIDKTSKDGSSVETAYDIK